MKSRSTCISASVLKAASLFCLPYMLIDVFRKHILCIYELFINVLRFLALNPLHEPPKSKLLPTSLVHNSPFHKLLSQKNSQVFSSLKQISNPKRSFRVWNTTFLYYLLNSFPGCGIEGAGDKEIVRRQVNNMQVSSHAATVKLDEGGVCSCDGGASDLQLQSCSWARTRCGMQSANQPSVAWNHTFGKLHQNHSLDILLRNCIVTNSYSLNSILFFSFMWHICISCRHNVLISCFKDCWILPLFECDFTMQFS